MDFAAIIAAIPNLKQLFEHIDSCRGRGELKYQEAVTALYTALNETQIYVGKLENGKERDSDTESALSRLWLTASTKLRTVDNVWAVRCFDKAGYWTNPNSWTRQQIQDANIKIEAVFQDARRLIVKE